MTDGETNATLRKGDEVETIAPERAYELLAEKRARGPLPAQAGRGQIAGCEEVGGEEAGDREALTARPGGSDQHLPRDRISADYLSAVAMGNIDEALTLPLDLA